MKISFEPPMDGRVHMFCMLCMAEAITRRAAPKQGSTYDCAACGHKASRAVIIDPEVAWWCDTEKEHWHETAGVFTHHKGRFLFFERTQHPLGLTVPAGHRNNGEATETTGVRELAEETGLRVTSLSHIATHDIWGDECRRGADVHRWHIFTCEAPSTKVTIDGREGKKPVWLTLSEAAARNLTPAVRHIITRYSSRLAAEK